MSQEKLGELENRIDWARPTRELLRLSWPITVSMLSYSAMTLTDTLVVGRVGSAALAGVGLGGTAAFTLLCFAFGLLRGCKTLVAQALGANRRDEIAPYESAALLVGALLGLLATALGVAMAPAVGALASTPAAAQAASSYLTIRILGAPFVLIYIALRESRYGQGDSRTPMIATVVANIVNIALACTFVLGLHWGVRGAAWATVVAHAVEAVVLLASHPRIWRTLGAARARHVRALFNMGLPTGLQFVLEMGSFAVLAALVAGMGEAQMAAHYIVVQLIHFSFLPALAVSEAAAVMAGQAVGADRDELVLPIARKALLVTGIFTGICAAASALAPRWILAPFGADAAVTVVAVKLLYVAATFQMFDGANIVARCVLRGVGDVRVPAVVGIVTSWVLTPPLAWLLGVYAGWGALGGWLGLCAEIVFASLILWRRLERREWLVCAVRSRASLHPLTADVRVAA